MTDLLKTKVRVGQIAYTNCLPFYHQLYHGSEDDFVFYRDVPAKINRAIRRGEIDIAPISSLEYLNHQDDYVLLPDFAIASRDFSGSVLLFSHQKIETLQNELIALSRESLSSVALLKILLKFNYKFDNKYVVCPSDPEEMLKKFQAALVIGDDALYYEPKEFVYKYDLSELWWSWTEKPFCYALWAVRREFVESHPDEVRAFSARLKENVEKNLLDIEGLIRDALQIDFLDKRFSKTFGYLFNLNYSLDEDVLEGLGLFYRLARRLGVSPKLKEFDFFK